MINFHPSPLHYFKLYPCSYRKMQNIREFLVLCYALHRWSYNLAVNYCVQFPSLPQLSHAGKPNFLAVFQVRHLLPLLAKERIFEGSLILNYFPFSLYAVSHSLSLASKQLSAKATCLSHSKVQEFSPRVCSRELACLKQNQTGRLDFSREDICHYPKEKYIFH